MSGQNQTPAGSLRIPASQAYWAVLDSSGLPRGRARREALSYQLEPWLPVPLESVVARFLEYEQGVVVAVALPREALGDCLERGAHSVGIEGPPSFLAPELLPRVEAALQGLEFLQGDLTPAPLRQIQVRATRVASLCVALGLCFLSVGFLRRAAADRSVSAMAWSHADSLYRAALGPLATGAILPLPLLMDAELRRHEQASRVAADGTASAEFEADAFLGRLLASWPAESAGVEVDSLVLAAGVATVRGIAKGTEEVSELVNALRGCAGASIEEPSVRVQQGGVAFTLRIHMERVP